MAFSSRLETRFDGETSSSPRSVDVLGAYNCKDDGCEAGSTIEEVFACIANGIGEWAGRRIPLESIFRQ